MRQPFDIEDPDDNENLRKSSSARSSLSWKLSQKESSSLPVKIVIAIVLCGAFVVVYFVFLRGNGNSAGVRRTTDMDTPLGHDFEYRNFELTNGLKVVLASNEEELDTNVQLCVWAGYLDEKPKQVGLASVVAKALLSSSVKDGAGSWNDEPEDEEEREYGDIEDVVLEEVSCFMFTLETSGDEDDEEDEDVSEEDQEEDHDDLLPELLDRFADMFVEPKFESQVLKQIIDDESTFRTWSPNSDYEEMDTLSRAIFTEEANPEHPLHYTARVKPRFVSQKFQGTPEELQVAATAFFKENYVANDMSLVVAGPLNLAALQEVIASSFGKIPKKSSDKDESEKRGPAKYSNLTFTKWEGFLTIYDPHPEPIPVDLLEFPGPMLPLDLLFEAEDRIQWEVFPGAPRVSFRWRIPEWHAGEYWSKKPWAYARWALSWMGRGSMISALRSKGWATTLGAGVLEDSAAFEEFWIDIRLTEEGGKNIQGIGEIVFAYLQLLRDHQQDWVMEEQQKIGHQMASLIPVADSEDLVHILAVNALKYPPKYVLTGSYVILEIDMQAAVTVLSHFTMDKCRVEFTSNDEEVAKGLSKAIEVLSDEGDEGGSDEESDDGGVIWEQIKYDHKEIDAGMLAAWKEASHLASSGKFMEGVMKLPPPNPLVLDPKSLQMVEIDNPPSQPQLITGAGMPRIYHQAYVEGGNFQFHIDICIYSQALDSDAKDFGRWQLWEHALSNVWKEEWFDAFRLGHVVSYGIERGVLMIRVETYGDVAHELMKKLANVMLETVTVSSTIKESRMTVLKENLDTTLKQTRPMKLALRMKKEALESWRIPWAEQLKYLEEYTEADMTVDPKKIFEACFVEALVIGNVLADDAKRYVETFTSAVQASQGENEKKLTLVPRKQEAILSEKPSLLTLDGLLKGLKTHYIAAHLQVLDAATPVNAAFIHLLCKFLAQKEEQSILISHQLPMNMHCPAGSSDEDPLQPPIGRQVVEFKFELRTEHPSDRMLQLMHHELNAALDRVAKCDAESFNRLKAKLEQENANRMDSFALVEQAHYYRQSEFENRLLGFDSSQKLGSGFQTIDVDKFHGMISQLKRRWFYIVVKKTSSGPDKPEISKEDMKKAGIEEFSDVEFEAFDRDAFRSSAEWKDVVEHDLAKPAPA